MLPVIDLKPGDRLKIEKKTYVTGEHTGIGRGRKEYEEVRVIRQYPHHVLVEDCHGIRQCPPNAEIYAMMMRKNKIDGTIYNKKGEKVCIRE